MTYQTIQWNLRQDSKCKPCTGACAMVACTAVSDRSYVMSELLKHGVRLPEVEKRFLAENLELSEVTQICLGISRDDLFPYRRRLTQL